MELIKAECRLILHNPEMAYRTHSALIIVAAESKQGDIGDWVVFVLSHLVAASVSSTKQQ